MACLVSVSFWVLETTRNTVLPTFKTVINILLNHDHVGPNHVHLTSSLHHKIDQTFPLFEQNRNNCAKCSRVGGKVCYFWSLVSEYKSGLRTDPTVALFNTFSTRKFNHCRLRIINPLRMRRRVTVVCLCVCLSVTALAAPVLTSTVQPP